MYSIGVDLGGTNIALGLVDENGVIVKKRSIPTRRERTYQEIMEDLASSCNTIVADANVPLSSVSSVGIGSPGICDNHDGMIIYANNLRFENVPVRKLVQSHIDLPVYIENDANCAAIGEYQCGAAKGYMHSITITLGTGVGSGIVVQGRLVTGAFYGGGELGHHVILTGGEDCTCGRKGCWEAYASATALIRDTKLALIRHPQSAIAEVIGGDINAITAKTAFDAAEKGDETAKTLIARYLDFVAEGLANVINIFQPEVVVIGGGVCAQGEAIAVPIRKLVTKKVYGGIMQTKIVIAQLGNDAGIIGAAMLHRMLGAQ